MNLIIENGLFLLGAAAAINAGCAVFLGNEEIGFAVDRPDRPRKVPGSMRKVR